MDPRTGRAVRSRISMRQKAAQDAIRYVPMRRLNSLKVFSPLQSTFVVELR